MLSLCTSPCCKTLPDPLVVIPRKEKKITGFYTEFYKKGGSPDDEEWAALLAPGTGITASYF